ncbi:hypothetical protein YC2023_014302 [Brassica napus]
MRKRDCRKPRGDHSDIRNDSDIFFYSSNERCVVEKAFRVENPKVVTMQRADRMASVFAMNGDLTKVWIANPKEGVDRDEPKKTHPNPAVFVTEFQTPYVLHVIDPVSSFLLDGCPREISEPAVSSGEIALSSKTKVFLAVQMAHQIHERTLKVIPLVQIFRHKIRIFVIQLVLDENTIFS